MSKTSFPWKLHNLLQLCHQQGETSVTWRPDGRSFQVVQRERFAKIVMPLHFRSNTFKSFQRNLNLWGFRVVSEEDGPMVYFHQFFRREKPDLCKIKRVGVVSSCPSFSDTNQLAMKHSVSQSRARIKDDDDVSEALKSEVKASPFRFVSSKINNASSFQSSSYELNNPSPDSTSLPYEHVVSPSPSSRIFQEPYGPQIDPTLCNRTVIPPYQQQYQAPDANFNGIEKEGGQRRLIGLHLNNLLTTLQTQHRRNNSMSEQQRRLDFFLINNNILHRQYQQCLLQQQHFINTQRLQNVRDRRGNSPPHSS